MKLYKNTYSGEEIQDGKSSRETDHMVQNFAMSRVHVKVIQKFYPQHTVACSKITLHVKIQIGRGLTPNSQEFDTFKRFE
jgi:hypothetical protein